MTDDAVPAGGIDTSGMKTNLSADELGEVQAEVKQQNEMLAFINGLADDPEINVNMLLNAALIKAVKTYQFVFSLEKDDPRRMLARDVDQVIQFIRTAMMWDNEFNRLYHTPAPEKGVRIVVPDSKIIVPE